jgi:heterodisulfide reductase subunit C
MPILILPVVEIIITLRAPTMKKEQEEAKKFVENTFSSLGAKGKSEARPNIKKSKKKRAAIELRLKSKVPEEDIVRENIRKLVEYREKNSIKSSVVQGFSAKG